MAAQESQLKKIVFERLNGGGVKLQHQETRNALYDGPLNRLCIELSEEPSFRRMWRIPLRPNEGNIGSTKNPSTKKGLEMYRKMDDVEMVLRFFAYRQMRNWSGASLNNIGYYLEEFLRLGNNFSERLLSQYRGLFKGTLSLLNDVLGDLTFCR